MTQTCRVAMVGQKFMGRAHSNATFNDSHAVDGPSGLWFAMDLAPLAAAEESATPDFVRDKIRHLERDVLSLLPADFSDTP